MLSIWRRSVPVAEPQLPLTRKQPATDNLSLHARAENQHRGAITYASESKNIKFVCHLPPDSKHVAEAQNLSLEIFTGRQASSRNPITGSKDAKANGSKLLTEQEYQPTAAMHKSNPIDSTDEVSKFTEAESDNYGFAKSNRVKITTQTPKLPQYQRRTTDELRQRHGTDTYTPASVSGQKCTTDTHETYMLKSGNERKLFASAPTASRTAEYHDKMVSEGLSPGKSKALRSVADSRQRLIESRR